MTEEAYLDAVEQYGDEFKAGMGAEAIKELQSNFFIFPSLLILIKHFICLTVGTRVLFPVSIVTKVSQLCQSFKSCLKVRKVMGFWIIPIAILLYIFSVEGESCEFRNSL